MRLYLRFNFASKMEKYSRWKTIKFFIIIVNRKMFKEVIFFIFKFFLISFSILIQGYLKLKQKLRIIRHFQLSIIFKKQKKQLLHSFCSVINGLANNQTIYFIFFLLLGIDLLFNTLLDTSTILVKNYIKK